MLLPKRLGFMVQSHRVSWKPSSGISLLDDGAISMPAGRQMPKVELIRGVLRELMIV
jgi:hypothetical protein